MLKLTRRQETFIKKLFDLYKDVEAPIHYSELAEQMGVNRFTAYDMLRLLEEKGLVASEYVLNEEKAGPGRSAIVFKPTTRAYQLLSDMSGDAEGEDWALEKARILESIQTAENTSGVDITLIREVFARMPPEKSSSSSSILYCIEVMTIIALSLSKIGRLQFLTEYLPQIVPSHNQTNLASLELLGGFALGFLASDDAGVDLDHELFKHVKCYTQLVAEMSTQERVDLVSGLDAVFMPLLESLD